MNKFFSSCMMAACCMLLPFHARSQQNDEIVPGAVWNDINGKPINAHGGCVIAYNGTYYWYGELKKLQIQPGEDASSERKKMIAAGVSCYSSKDLLHWKFESVALPSNSTDTSNELHLSKVLERPKVLYNKRTGKFVMWLHVDSRDYKAARSGVAVSSTPTGPFRYIGSERPNGNMARDMTLFQDDDGKAYHFYSSEDNATMHICQLSDDYLSHTKLEKRMLIGQMREAPTVFKHHNKYYLITSACTGWNPNEASYAVADSIMGDWQSFSNPCVGEGADKTFGGQSTYVIPNPTRPGQYIFIADIWNPKNLEDSRYVWLPMTIINGVPSIPWKNKWKLSSTIDTIPAPTYTNGKLNTSSFVLTWSDEFNYNGEPDTSKWSYEIGYKRNHEAQYYTNTNTSCDGSQCTIQARRNDSTYTSSSITTYGKCSFGKGYYELRAKIPTAPGVWPAWWALGNNVKSKGWPYSGEIDMMEYYRKKLLHNIMNSDGQWASKIDSLPPGFGNSFHTWGMYIDDVNIYLYMDGNLELTYQLENAQKGNYNPFTNQEMYMIINLALGGDNGGDPGATSYPQDYVIDYVRYYRMTSSL